ncbi:hypothetical protein AB0K80_10935 [Streptomyces sp. NPDC052682]|uniref:hypothetical protein n=1 Tax=Streptomyces sp. NPDC052682 TaxID=3154954 RepID=UPI0034449E1C
MRRSDEVAGDGMTSGGLVTARAEVAAPDDHGVAAALDGLVDGSGYWSGKGALAGIERTARYLAGTWDPAPPDEGPGKAGEGSWARFIGRIGAVALRAAVQPTRDERRRRLLTLLEIWADSPFADPRARIRTGLVRPAAGAPAAVRDERGAAVVVGWTAGGLRRFVDLRAGQGDPPSLGAIEEVTDVPRRGWGSAEQVRRLVGLVRERGPVPWDLDAVAVLREGTGLGRAAASFALAGMLTLSRLPRLDDTERKLYRVKVAEIEDGVREAGRMTSLDRLELVADVLPDDPAELWEPHGMRAVAERIAQAWRERYGRWTLVPQRTFDAALDLQLPRLSAGRFCAVFTDPASIRGVGSHLDTWIRNSDFSPFPTAGGWDLADFEDTLRTVVPNLFRVYTEFPAGDPVRAGAPGLVRALLKRLDHPGLLLDAGNLSRAVGRTAADVRDRFGARPYTGPEPLDAATLDDGLTVVVDGAVDRRGERFPPKLYFRPAFYGDDERSRTLRAARADSRYDPEPEFVEWLRGPACARIVERIENAPLPPGSYETNPVLSAPGVLAEAVTGLGVDEDAAALYLQLLTLRAPSDRAVRTWNGWTAARHEKAAAVLLERGLAVQDRRARAGRRLFLPGEWIDARKPYPPMEAWKAELLGVKRSYNGRLENPLPLPTRTLPELFAHAWDLVRRGRGPSA